LKIPIYIVDTFTQKQFAGNPAAVCILDSWLDDQILQSIAGENNLAETAFLTTNADGSFHIRWFTPSFEIPLCGHATLAASYVLFQYCGYSDSTIRFHSKSGELLAHQRGELLMLDFPAYDCEAAVLTDTISEALGARPSEFLQSGINYYAIYEREEQVCSLRPDYATLLDIMRGTEIIGFVPTSTATEYDFVSRYFAPEEGTGVTEDAVTGSIHSVLIPLWADRLGKSKMLAYQASRRGGELVCELKHSNDTWRTIIGGLVQPYLQGIIEV